MTGVQKQRLVFGDILDAYGTELFGQQVVRSEITDDLLNRLGKLNIKAAFGKITPEEEAERSQLQTTFATHAPVL